MGQLIPINRAQIANEQVNAVDARELHTFLESNRDFSSWIKTKLKKGQFVEGVDYSPNLVRNGERGQPRTEYILSLDTAKHIAMLEGNEKGHEARRYFIECEKQLLSIVPTISDNSILIQKLDSMSSKLDRLTALPGGQENMGCLQSHHKAKIVKLFMVYSQYWPKDIGVRFWLNLASTFDVSSYKLIKETDFNKAYTVAKEFCLANDMTPKKRTSFFNFR